MWKMVRARRIFTIAAALASSIAASAAFAQQYQTDPIDDKARALGRNAQIWVRDASAYNAGKAQFSEYFQNFYFPAMTRSSPGGLAEVGKLRVELFKKFLWGTTNEQLQKDLTDLAFKTMVKVVGRQEPPYHPTVTYNAVLVLGLLDDQYAIDSGGNARPPRPLPAATKALTQIVNAGVSSNRFPPSVVLGALIGLERHAKYNSSLPPESVKIMTEALLKVVSQEKPIQNMDPAAFTWLQLRAASALSNLRSVGENNAIHDAITKFIGNAKSIDDRCEAASFLGDIDYKDAKINAKKTTEALFKLAGDLSAEELKRAIDFENAGSTGFASSERIVSYDSTTPTDNFPRSSVLARIGGVRRGLLAVKVAVPDDSKQKIDAVVATFAPVIQSASNESIGSLQVAENIRRMNNQLVSLVGAPEVDEEDDFSIGGETPAEAAVPPAAEQPVEATAPAAEPATP